MGKPIVRRDAEATKLVSLRGNPQPGTRNLQPANDRITYSLVVFILTSMNKNDSSLRAE